MKPLTCEWVEKAEGDWNTAQRELRARMLANPDAVCFHAQQSAEKYLKGLLQEREIVFPRTHALDLLVSLLLAGEPSWEKLRPGLRKLSEGAVALRYPGASANLTLARQAVAICREVRRRARLGLGLGAERRTGSRRKRTGK
jgi:HEPN domain-containing protein